MFNACTSQESNQEYCYCVIVTVCTSAMPKLAVPFPAVPSVSVLPGAVLPMPTLPPLGLSMRLYAVVVTCNPVAPANSNASTMLDTTFH